MLMTQVNLEQAGKYETLCERGNRNMSTIVRKPASRRGEEYLEMRTGLGRRVDGDPSSCCSVRNVLRSVRVLENGQGGSRTGLLGILTLIVLSVIGIVLRLRVTASWSLGVTTIS
jgi:hypothetical protein